MTIANSTQPHTQPTILTGLRVNSEMTLGNFLGALLPMVRLANAHSDQYHVNIFVPDLHSIISEVDGSLQQNLLKSLKYFLAAGLNLNPNTHFYRQSRVPAHSELCWILNCVATMGELNRMTQYKDKSEGKDSVNVGIFDYPVLMAADILLYQTHLVPVGVDQRQHLEIARDIAVRFNNRYGETFRVPEGYIVKEGAKITSLQDPARKMSKSDENPNAAVFLSDDRDTVMRKFRRAVTDSGDRICASDDKPGVTNLLNIYAAFRGCTVAEAERAFEGRGYGEFKLAVGETVADALAPIQAEQKRLLADKGYLADVLKRGAESAAYVSRKTLSKVFRKVGFYRGE